MKQVELTSSQRIQLSALLGAQRGTIGETLLLFGILNKLKLSEEELAAIHYRVEGQSAQWEIQLGGVPIDLTEEEAKKILGILQSWTQFSVTDLFWLNPLLEALK